MYVSLVRPIIQLQDIYKYNSRRNRISKDSDWCILKHSLTLIILIGELCDESSEAPRETQRELQHYRQSLRGCYIVHNVPKQYIAEKKGHPELILIAEAGIAEQGNTSLERADEEHLDEAEEECDGCISTPFTPFLPFGHSVLFVHQLGRLPRDRLMVVVRARPSQPLLVIVIVVIVRVQSLHALHPVLGLLNQFHVVLVSIG